MRLVDTSAWIEWLIGSSIGQTLSAELPGRTEWLVPTIVQLELTKWLTREIGEDKADHAVDFGIAEAGEFIRVQFAFLPHSLAATSCAWSSKPWMRGSSPRKGIRQRRAVRSNPVAVHRIPAAPIAGLRDSPRPVG